MNDLQLFLDSPAGLAVKGALVAAGLDFVTGSFAALRDGTFALDSLAAWVRKHLLGRVLPLTALLGGAYISGDPVLSAFAITGLGAYAAETISSVMGNINPPKASDVKDNSAAAALNPVPTE